MRCAGGAFASARSSAWASSAASRARTSSASRAPASCGRWRIAADCGPTSCAAAICASAMRSRRWSDAALRAARGRGARLRPRSAGLGPEQGQLGLALAAEHREVDLDPRDPAGLGQDARLRLDRLGGEDAAAVRHRGVATDALEVAGELLDRVDGADALDLDRDPAVLVVAAHEVDGADVRRPLASYEPEA